MKIIDNLFIYPERGELDCNTYVFKGNPGVIIDPGNPDCLASKVAEMKEDGIKPEEIGFIINTHLHIDHSAANHDFKEMSGAQIALPPVQQDNYTAVVIDGARMFGLEPLEFKADCVLDKRLRAGNIDLEMLPAPGHSPECVCFYHRKLHALVCGDVLFEMNTGRVDLPGGSAPDLIKSIQSLSLLEIEYILPGHMGTVIGAAKVAANFNFIKTQVFPWL